MAKPHVTRTYGQIHFEDLDPNRFEDLIRELIYDYKDWQNLEATGRSGNDEGFDIRAFEKNISTSVTENSEGEEIEMANASEGNFWMIQCKREKEIGPKRIKEILGDVDKKTPPYGYILAASANFSKDSYDLFRAELQKLGVMEFHLWGKAELEDLLHQPKNDRILFTFFGISLVSKRKSRAAEIKSVVVNKNKIFRILGDFPGRKHILLRDSNDLNYPYKYEYDDFKKKPRWKEYLVSEYHPLGLIASKYNFFAYIDHLKKEFDYSSVVSRDFMEGDSDEEKETQRDMIEKVEDFWCHLPKRNQAYFFKKGLVRFSDMLVIDEKGDNLFKFPQIFVDFKNGAPFSGFHDYLQVNERQYDLNEYKRVKIFPKTFSAPKLGKFYKDKVITLEKFLLYRISHGNQIDFSIYELDGRYSYLEVRDAVGIPDPEDSSRKNYIEITHKESLKYKDYLRLNPENENAVKEQIGKIPSPEEVLNIYEFKITWDFKYDPSRRG